MSELDPSADAPGADAQAEADDNGGAAGGVSAVVDGAPSSPSKPRPDELQLSRPPAGQAPRPVVIARLRSRAGAGTLALLDEKEPPGGLELPDGAAGDVERALGRGETEAARNLAAGLTDFESETSAPGRLSDAECLQRTLVVRAHLMDGNLEAARAVMGRARDDERLALADAALCLGEGDLAKARQRIEAALARAPTGLGEHYTLGLIRVAEGRLQEAMQLLAKVAASAPEHAVARHQLGQLTLAHGDPARAGTLFEMAMSAAPGFLPPALSLVEMLIDSRQYGEAMALLNSITERAPTALAPHLLQLRLLVEVGETHAALQLGEALRRAAPDHAEVASLWAEAMAQAGRGEEAAEKLDGLVNASAGDVRAKLLRVLAHIDLAAEPPRTKSAVVRIGEAITCSQNPSELRLELAQLLLGTGDLEAAGNGLAELSKDPQAEVSTLLSGALLARNHGLWGRARLLGQAALDRVQGTPAEPQIAAFIEGLPPGD